MAAQLPDRAALEGMKKEELVEHAMRIGAYLSANNIRAEQAKAELERVIRTREETIGLLKVECHRLGMQCAHLTGYLQRIKDTDKDEVHARRPVEEVQHYSYDGYGETAARQESQVPWFRL